MKTIWNRVSLLGALAVAFALATGPVSAQSFFVPTTGTNDWNTAGNWNPSGVPDGPTAVAIISNAYPENIGVRLSADITLNRLIYSDAPTPNNYLRILDKRITFAGTSPSIANSNTFDSLDIYSTVRVDNVTLKLSQGGSAWVTLSRPFEGNGTLYIDSGRWSFSGVSSNFTGTIIISNRVAGALSGMESWQSGGNNQWICGDTNGATLVYDRGFLSPQPYSSVTTFAEPVDLYGINNEGSLRFMTWSNNVYSGPLTLHTNSTVVNRMAANYVGSLGHIRNVLMTGAIQDDGQSRGIHFLSNAFGGASNSVSILSRIAYSGEATYGGFTHISSAREPDVTGSYNMYLQLTNGNNRLPVGTTVFLGGLTNSSGLNIGARGASGILILGGADQELAGLYIMGGTGGSTGVNNRVVGGAPANSTLTLNLAAGVTNLYGGYLGGAGANENNLALTKKGSGFLNLTNVNTFTGPTTVEAGTLRIGGSHAGATTVKTGGTLNVDGIHTLGLITVEGGGTLGGIGTVGDIASTGTVAPGNSVGTLTANGNVTLNSGSTLTMELQDPLTDPSDALVMSGGVLYLNGTPELSLSLYGGYTPNIGDSFTILSGFVGSAGGFDPGFDGTFNNKPDGGTFSVSGSTFQIDYNANDIKLTVVPEPHTLGLLGLAALGGLLRRRIRG